MPVNKNITIGSYKKISSKNPSKIPPNKPLPKTSVKKINWPVLKYKEKGEKIRKEDLKRIGKAFKEYIENLFKSKVEPFAPIEDIYVKYNDWYRHFDE